MSLKDSQRPSLGDKRPSLGDKRPSLGESKRMSSRRLVDFDSDQLLSMEEIRDNVRLTASKLLNDLGSSDEEEDDSEDEHDQLPNADDARLYAGRLLGKNKNPLEKTQSIRKPINVLRSLRVMKDMRRDITFSSELDAMSVEMDVHDDMPPKSGIFSKKVFCILGTLALVAVAVTIMVFFQKNDVGDTDPTVSSSPPEESETPRMQSIIDLLVNKGISESEALNSEGTPQRQAADWIANTDTLQYDTKEDKSRLIQRYALTVFYYALNGPEWKHQLNFLAPEKECNWYRDIPAQKVDDVYSIGVTCNAYLQVETILLRK